MDDKGFVLTGPDAAAAEGDGNRAGPRTGFRPFLLETSQPGVFAVGDVRSGSVKRVASAVGEAAWPCGSSTSTWSASAARRTAEHYAIA